MTVSRRSLLRASAAAIAAPVVSRLPLVDTALAEGAAEPAWKHGLSLFGEYKANYSWNDVDVSGGTLKTDVLTHQFAGGVSFRFGGGSH